jgi:two-component system, NarL family, response regulator NreC
MTTNLNLARAANDPECLAQATRVVLADDHRIVRRNLRILLEGEKDVEVVAEAGDMFTAVRHVGGHQPRVLLLDLGMSNGSSIEAIRQLRRQAPGTEIVVLTMEDSPAFAQRALEVGAMGYVLKDHADSELPTAIRSAARGKTYISPRVGARLGAQRRTIEEGGLSPRETEVLRLIALGLTNTEIAEKLQLSRRTVESHRVRIHRKLGLVTRAELVRYALAGHLIGECSGAA